MIEKALLIILFMYASSFSLLGVQYVIADVIGVDLVSIDGTPIKSHILGLINEDQLNEVSANIVSANFTGNSTYYDKIETFTTGAAFVAWELVTLLSGTYIFNFMWLMGVPEIFVGGFVILYLMLLARAVIGLVRGI